MVAGARAKVYVEGSRGDLRVPFSEVSLAASPELPGGNPPVRLYDTSGPGGSALEGLEPLRRPWVLERGDVEPYEGRPTTLRDDGRAAVRRAAPADATPSGVARSEEHTSELQSRGHLVCRRLREKKKT